MSVSDAQDLAALVPDVSLDDVRRIVADRSAKLVAVVSRDHYDMGHIPGSLSLPVDDIPRLTATVLPESNEDIVVYCGGPT